ncbi:betaine-aldehyde dehydrogenase [Aliidiomarina minuta]|uniref:Betaine-aldehyde dehydrogenase n=1 Tax=Aliidiomarina minuta TaxID=880057 RepID=A0A432WAR8_9GAMM|nr:betaine-aldehyde dehydrogenase [Aliidiomarina minuta]RUO27076.1 betaine-aldehyde dehydrogenase [Aliidiomarina minuta]
MSTELLKNYVHGQFASTQSGVTFDVINPATGAMIYPVEQADEPLMEAALSSAAEGFKLWSATPAIERARILQRAAALLREHNDELARLEVLDTGKPWQEACEVDVQTGADAIEYFANLCPSLMGEQQSVGDDFFYTREEPLGICLGIGAWNYPLQIACWKSAAALAAGNSMIFKPSEETPRGAAMLAQIFSEAGVPDGVFNVVQGDADVGKYLVNHSAIAKVSLTGEVGTGKKVMAAAAGSLKAVTMELGGKSPMIIFDDADLDEAVTGAMMGNFYTQGEVCTNGTRVFVHESMYDAFVERLVQRTESNIIAADPMDPKTNLGALISRKHMQSVLDYIETGKQEGATLLTGGTQLHPEGCENGFFVAPTVFTNCSDEMTICREEIFGPVMSVLTFTDEDDVIQRANNTEFGLAAGVFTKDIRRAHRVIAQMQAGICWINAWGNSPAEMPVGGYKQSGIGRENGVQTLKSYTQTKSVYVGMQPLEGPF